jgi:hypothetical protein
MTPNTPTSPAPPATPSANLPPPTTKKTRWPFYVLGAFFALLLVIVATVAFTLWWIQRPIKPVVLSAREKAVVEQKLQQLGGSNANAAAPEPDRGAKAAGRDPNPEPDRPYVPGDKVLRLTEREINGLLNANTDLGKTVRLEFARDAVNAYLAVPIPEDFPIGGGKIFRARGRFRLSLDQGEAPYAILEDVTVFGLSLPKAWLAGLKGENLLGQAMGERKGSPVLKGVKNLRIEPGALVLEVED